MCGCLSAPDPPVGVYVDDCLADEIGRIIKNLVDSLDIRSVDVLAILVEPVHGSGHDQHILRKQAIKPDEKQSVGYRQLRLRGNAPAQHVQLMPQHHDLGFQSRLRLKRRDQDVEEQDQELERCASN